MCGAGRRARSGQPGQVSSLGPHSPPFCSWCPRRTWRCTIKQRCTVKRRSGRGGSVVLPARTNVLSANANSKAKTDPLGPAVFYKAIYVT